MASRYLYGTIDDYYMLEDQEYAYFNQYNYGGDPIPNANATGGTITFTNIRTYYSDFYFVVYVGGVEVCETVRIMDQNRQPHELTVDIDTADYCFENPHLLLTQSGAISVRVCDNVGRDDSICRFEIGAEITIKANHNVSVKPYAPTFSQSNDGKVTISWSAAKTSGGGSGSIDYTLVYGEEGSFIHTGTSRSTTITIPSSWYGKSVGFRVSAVYSGVEASSEAAYFTASYPTVSAPTN